jgi:hypothetical protein
MAKKPDGSSAGTQRVTFTKGAAERIGKVVREVEAGNRDLGPLTFGPRVGGTSGTPIRLAYYTATSNWFVALPGAATSTSNTQKIQFAFPTGQTAATALCVNNIAFLPLLTTNATAAAAVRTILVFKEAGEWRLMGART